MGPLRALCLGGGLRGPPRPSTAPDERNSRIRLFGSWFPGRPCGSHVARAAVTRPRGMNVSSVLATTTEGNGSRWSGMGAKPAVSGGKPGASVSLGATSSVPRTLPWLAGWAAAQCATRMHARLRATSTTGRGASVSARSSVATQSSLRGVFHSAAPLTGREAAAPSRTGWPAWSDSASRKTAPDVQVVVPQWFRDRGGKLHDYPQPSPRNAHRRIHGWTCSGWATSPSSASCPRAALAARHAPQLGRLNNVHTGEDSGQPSV